MGSYVSDCEPSQKQTHWYSIAKLPTVHGEPTLLHSLVDRQLQAEEYRLIIPIQSVEQQIKNYRNRLQKWTNLINIYHISSQQTSLNCMKRIELSVITERVHYRLKDLSKEILTDQQGWYLLHQALNGLLQYYRVFRSFIYLNSRMIGIKSTGQVRIWVNQNWTLNQSTKKAQSQNYMVDELIEEIKEYLPTNNRITKFHLQKFNRNFKMGDVLRQCQRNIKQIEIESIRKKISYRLRNNVQNFLLEQNKKQTLNHSKQTSFITKLQFCSEDTRKLSLTDRTMHTNINYSKVSQPSQVSHNQNKNCLNNSNSSKNHSVPTCFSPSYIFSPVLFTKPQRIKTNYTDRSYALQSPTPVCISYNKQYPPEVNACQTQPNLYQDNQDSFLKSRNIPLNSTYKDGRSKINYYETNKNYSVASPISVSSKVVFNYTSSDVKSNTYQQIQCQQSSVKPCSRLSFTSWIENQNTAEKNKQIRIKTEQSRQIYQFENQSIINQSQCDERCFQSYGKQIHQNNYIEKNIQKNTNNILVLQNNDWKTCSVDICNKVMKKRQKVAEEQQTIGENSRSLSQPPNLQNCNLQFDDLTVKLPNHIVLSEDLSEDPYFQQMCEKKAESIEFPTYKDTQTKNISDTYQGKNVIEIFKFYLDSYNNLQKSDPIFKQQQISSPVGNLECKNITNEVNQQQNDKQSQDSYGKQSYQDFNSYLDTIQQASQGQQSITAGFVSRKNYQ